MKKKHYTSLIELIKQTGCRFPIVVGNKYWDEDEGRGHNSVTIYAAYYKHAPNEDEVNFSVAGIDSSNYAWAYNNMDDKITETERCSESFDRDEAWQHGVYDEFYLIKKPSTSDFSKIVPELEKHEKDKLVSILGGLKQFRIDIDNMRDELNEAAEWVAYKLKLLAKVKS